MNKIDWQIFESQANRNLMDKISKFYRERECVVTWKLSEVKKTLKSTEGIYLKMKDKVKEKEAKSF